VVHGHNAYAKKEQSKERKFYNPQLQNIPIIMKLKTLLLSSLVLLLAACSKDSAQLTCASVDGYQSEAITVSEEPFTLEQSGDGETRTLSIMVKMTANEHISGITELDPNNITLDDKFGVKIVSKDISQTLKIDSDSAKTAFINLLKAKKGTEANIKFSAKVTKDDAKKLLNNAEQFSITELNVDLENITLSGNIGKYPVCMTINVEHGGRITGAYYYKRMGPGALLYFKSDYSSYSPKEIPEFDINGNNTGTFEGTFKDDVFSGKFTTRGNTYIYSLRSDASVEPIDLSAVPFDSFELPQTAPSSSDSNDIDSADSDVSSSIGSTDIDDLLDSYERCIDKCITIMKKAKNNDPTALADYAEYVSEMQDYAKKLENVKGDLSTAQMQRFTRLLTKAARAAQQ